MKTPLALVSLSLALAACAGSYGNHGRSASEGATGRSAGLESRGRPSTEGGGASASKFEREFERLDRNHDGRIDKSEAKKDPALYANFDKFDVHHTGALSRPEFLRYERWATGSQNNQRNPRNPENPNAYGG